MRFRFFALMIGGFCPVVISAQVLRVDYSYDSSGFFTRHPAARAALEQAAADISRVLTGTFSGSPDNPIVGERGRTRVEISWESTINHPSKSDPTRVTTAGFTADTITVYAGAKPLVKKLGLGETGGISISLKASGYGSGWAAAMAAAEKTFNAGMRADQGPILHTMTGSLAIGDTTTKYALRYGVLTGSISFNNDADGDGTADRDLSGLWHFDHTTAVAAGTNDFYSVALHELLHVLGFGSGASWESRVDGNAWRGPMASARQGGGAGLIALDRSHLTEGTMSTTLDGGRPQQAVMDPALTVGTRNSLTALDAAILSDLGYDVAGEAEPASRPPASR